MVFIIVFIKSLCVGFRGSAPNSAGLQMYSDPPDFLWLIISCILSFRKFLVLFRNKPVHYDCCFSVLVVKSDHIKARSFSLLNKDLTFFFFFLINSSGRNTTNFFLALSSVFILGWRCLWTSKYGLVLKQRCKTSHVRCKKLAKTVIDSILIPGLVKPNKFVNWPTSTSTNPKI